MNLGKWRWPVLTVLPCVTVGVLMAAGVVRVQFTAASRLSHKGTVKMVTGVGSTPSQAIQSAQRAADVVIQGSLAKKQAALREKIAAIQKRQDKLVAMMQSLSQEQKIVRKGIQRPWTPAMAQQLASMAFRREALRAYPTHTDIPILEQQIKALEAQRRGSGIKVDTAQVTALGKKINEARVETSLLTKRVKALTSNEKNLKSDWTVMPPPVPSHPPVNVPGWPVTAGAAVASFVLGYVLTLSRKKQTFAADPIKLALVSDASNDLLPDNPQTRHAAALYDRWLAVVQALYAPNTKPPENIFGAAEPLFKETAAFLPQGQDTLTRHVARVVLPGDLPAHVTRTVLMALIGSYEAGATSEQQQGMMFAALFHDLAVAPRPAEAAQEIGSEVGRLSTGLLTKIPGLPGPLRILVEQILIGMDEYSMATWHNVARSEAAEPFAKLLRHIDRFDKVLQKQKSRLSRRLPTAA